MELVGELSPQSDLFRQLWASHDATCNRSGATTSRHPVVAQLEPNSGDGHRVGHRPTVHTAAAGDLDR